MKTKPTTEKEYTTFRISLLLWSCLAVLLIKIPSAFRYSSDTWTEFAASWVQDTFIEILLYLLFSHAGRKSKAHNQRANITFAIIMACFVISSRIYSRHIPDLQDFPVNLFGVESGTASFFLDYFLEPIFIIEAATGTTLMIGLARFLPLRLNRNTLYTSLVMAGILFAISLRGPAVNPILYSLLDESSRIFKKDYGIKALDEKETTKTQKNFPELMQEFRTYPNLTLRYNKIVVLVMESINYNEFISARKDIKQDFHHQLQSNTISYRNYYSCNLDSYTGLFVMLNSVMIPYQAYVNEEKYIFLNRRPNLINFFNRNGFKACFLTSYGEQQKRFIPDYQDWTEIKCLKTFPKNYAIVNSVKIERAAEDFAVFPDLIKELRNNRKIFLFQELVYGHTREWKKKTGINTIDYYNRYFNALWENLSRANLLDSTLLVITSDHGPRKNQADRENYHIPLLLCAKNLRTGYHDEFLSHIDFKNILLGKSSGTYTIAERQQIYTVGNSGNMVYGMINRSGKFIFINNRTLEIETNTDEDAVRLLNADFAAYRNSFSELSKNK